MKETSPRVSIITATLNAAALLPYTIRSLRGQTCRDFEWIVVDGNSNDGTQALLRENADVVTRWISEPDRGIYDAWNKACKMVRGEWVIFFGAGDELAAPHTLAECIRQLESVSPDATIVYGRQILLSPKARIPLETIGVPWAQMQGKWDIGRPALPPHGATFQSKKLFVDEQPFDLRFSIASDSHFLLRAIRKQVPTFIPIDITRSPTGGISLRLSTARQVSREIAAIDRDLGLTPPLSARLHETLRLAVISLLNLLPQKTAHQLADSIRLLLGQSRRWTIR
ncbi:MAG: glycosyltransferase family 2 protein [Pseudomonadota bacterium]